MEASDALEPDDDGRTLGDDITEEAAASTIADVIPARGPAAYLAEFIGTFALVLFITLVVSEFVTAPDARHPGGAAVQPFIDFSVIGAGPHVRAVLADPDARGGLGRALQPRRHGSRWPCSGRSSRSTRRSTSVLQLAGGVLGALVTKLILNNLDNAQRRELRRRRRSATRSTARSASACWSRGSARSSSSGRSSAWP